MPKRRVIKVTCRCGQPLFRYYKLGRGRLIKCFLGEIRRDDIGILGEAVGARPACPRCGKELGIVRLVRGRPALKINQGTIQETRT